MNRLLPITSIFALGLALGVSLSLSSSLRPVRASAAGAAVQSDPLSAMAVDHIALVTRDFSSLTRWYVETLDFRIEARWTAPGVVPGLQLAYLVHPSGVRLEIAGGPSVRAAPSTPRSVAEDFGRAGYRHVCFSVADVDAVHTHLKARGVKVLAAPFDFPKLSRRLTLLQDPEGNCLEFVAPMAEPASPGRNETRG